jgi:hypothetical protein
MALLSAAIDRRDAPLNDQAQQLGRGETTTLESPLNARHVTSDLVHRCVQFALPAFCEEYERAFIDEPLCRRKPDPAAAAKASRCAPEPARMPIFCTGRDFEANVARLRAEALRDSGSRRRLRLEPFGILRPDILIERSPIPLLFNPFQSFRGVFCHLH